MHFQSAPKVIIFTLAVLGAADAYGCCEEEHFYRVTNVKAGDVLNVRKHPHPKAAVVGTIRPDSKNMLTIAESAAVEQIECIKQALDDPNINKTFADPENDKLVQPYRHLMVPAPGESGTTKGTWCRVSIPGSGDGWVNASFLKYHCTETIGDSGGRGPCEKRAAKKSGKTK